jgi:hypothetical protein
LPPVFGSDKDEALIVHLETVHLNGVFTIDLIKSLMDTIHKLSVYVVHLKSGNVSLGSQINKLHEKYDHNP